MFIYFIQKKQRPLYRGLLFHHSNSMRIIFYLISFIIISTCIFSCAKESLVNDPQFGNVSFVNAATETIDIKRDTSKFKADGIKVSLPSGKNQFRFYAGDQLLKDTLLSVEPYTTHVYTLFKPDRSSALQIFDSGLNGFNKEILPDSGLVKFSIANFSASFPNKVNVYISTKTYTPNSDKTIQVGDFLNVSRSFSEFHTVMTGVNSSSNVVNAFTLIIKSTDNNTVLATIPLVLSTATGGKLSASVYLLYIRDMSSASILMSK